MCLRAHAILVVRMQRACAVLYCRLRLVWIHIVVYLVSQHDVEHKMCALFPLQILSEIFPILLRIQREVILNVHRPSCKVPVILVVYESNLNFLDRFHENSSSGGPSCFNADGWTEKHDEANDRFSQFLRTRLKK
jgi:hypothetical protein